MFTLGLATEQLVAQRGDWFFATSVAMGGVATWRIRKQTGHASDVMLGRYIRDGELFTDNAAGVIL